MKVYKIKVNGKAYEVELEAVSESSKSIEVAPKATPQAAPASAGDQVIKAPMAGSILEVKVAVGDQIEKGQTIAILEAMKLENEIKASCSGTVKSIAVSKGSAVKNGDTLIVVC